MTDANICGWLVRHGYDDGDIRAVLGGNIYRALQSIWVLPHHAGAPFERHCHPAGRAALPES